MPFLLSPKDPGKSHQKDEGKSSSGMLPNPDFVLVYKLSVYVVQKHWVTVNCKRVAHKLISRTNKNTSALGFGSGSVCE